MQTALGGDIWRRIGAIAAALAVALIAYWLVRHIPRTIAIFVIAAFIAFGVQPVAARLERRMPKPLAISIVFVGLLLAVAILLVIVVPLTVNQVQLLAANIPSYATTAQGWLISMESSFNAHFPTLQIPAYELNFGKIGASQIAGVVAAAVASLAAPACATYQEDLARAQHAYEGSEDERALAIFRMLEPDVSRLPPADRAHYAYLRGMTDYRIGYKAEARHWLAVAAAIEQQTPNSLPEEWVKRMNESLKELNEAVFTAGIESLTNSAEEKAKGSDDEASSDDSSGDKPRAKPKPKPAKSDDE